MEFKGITWRGDGFRVETSEQDRVVWFDERGDALVAMHIANPPDIPRMAGESAERATREYYRAAAHGLDGGIVEVGYGTLDGLRAVRTLIKRRLEPRGFGFVGAWLVPFEEDFLTFRFESVERGITGAREAAVMLTMPTMPDVGADGRLIEWIKDPYDAAYDETALYNPADDARYDEMFPKHPLSKVRRHLRAFGDTVRFDAAYRKRRQHIA